MGSQHGSCAAARACGLASARHYASGGAPEASREPLFRCARHGGTAQEPCVIDQGLDPVAGATRGSHPEAGGHWPTRLGF